MTAPYRKKLIEVALPLKAINEAAAREKSIRHGHPSTLHLWWARRPLAACRAVLFASLVDDPESDPAYRNLDGSVDKERAARKRAQLFDLIEELVKWENTNNPRVINNARAEIARCVASRKIETGELRKETIIFGEQKGKPHPKGAVSGERVTAWEVVLMQAVPEVVNAFLAEHAPPVLDPFCGGGSIPLEALRLGLRAYASDLNPVPVLITKALIETPPKFVGMSPIHPRDVGERKKLEVWEGAQGLAEDVRYYGQWMRDEANKRIGHLYPKVKITRDMAVHRADLKEYVGKELTVIAWLWARTVASPNPAMKGAHTPLVRSFYLSTKKGKEAWVRPIIDRKSNAFHFAVGIGKQPSDLESGTGTVNRSGGRCLISSEHIPFPHIRNEGKANRLAAHLIAIVAEKTQGRVYVEPVLQHSKVAESAKPTWRPAAPISHWPGRTNVVEYGLDTFDKLFTPRQLVALTTFSDLVTEAREQVLADVRKARFPVDDRRLADGGVGGVAYADAVATYLAFGVSKAADYNSNLVSWITQRDQARSTFSKQALPMIWDYCEVNPFAVAAGDPLVSLRGIAEVLGSLMLPIPGTAQQLDATAALVAGKPFLISTDPPYYDNIGYADLSDFFYVWLRRSLSGIYPSLFATLLTPKTQELIASPYRHEGSKDKAQAFFETGLGQAFRQMQTAQNSDYPFTVYYAFKQAETDEGDEDDDESEAVVVSTGWETMLEGLIRSGFSVHGTWPMRTERSVRSVGLGTNALASSIVLVCRPRPANAPLATRKQFVTALRQELPEALKDLQQGFIAPVDLAQAAIGPGMAVFTRYSKVLEADGSSMTVRTALGLINQTLDETLVEQEGDFDAETRWAVAWFDQFGMTEGPFGVAETLSKAKNTAVNGLVEAGVITARGGKVRLVKRDELPEDWNPATDRRVSVWETVQHLIRSLEKEGESPTANLLHQLGGIAETARELAYRLYTVCERKKWADEALAYNTLVIAWPELTKLAQAVRETPPTTQREFF